MYRTWKRGSLHAHVLVSIEHNSKIHIDANFITKNFCHYLQHVGFRKMDSEGNEQTNFNVYCHVKFVPISNEEKVKAYMLKEDEHENVYPEKEYIFDDEIVVTSEDYF